jgi:hypothetical protein
MSTKFARAAISERRSDFRCAAHFSRLWYVLISDAIDYARFYSRSHNVVIRVYDEAGNVIETHEHAGDFGEP